MKTWVFETTGDQVVQRIALDGPPTLGAVTPTTVPPLTLSLQADPADPQYYLVTIAGGVPGIDYAAVINMGTGNGLIACSVKDAVQSVVPYSVVNPSAFNDLVGALDAGQSAVGTGVFSFGPTVDAAGGTVSWDLVDQHGKVWAAGLAYDYAVQSNGWSTTVVAHALVTAPSDIPTVLDGQAYQLRWSLELPDGQKFYTFENLQITADRTVPLGAASAVELMGDQAVLQLVTSDLHESVRLEIYDDNTQVGSAVVAAPGLPTRPVRTADGWLYEAHVDTTSMSMSYLKPWSVIWKYGAGYSERADLWVVGPTVSQAMEDMKAKINKARTTLYGAPDLLFPYSTILTWLRRAADYFNTSYGVLTAITFVNPSGPIREYWLMIAEMFAIEAQFLAEGEKAFDFQGAAISLSVDKTQYLDAMASKIQGRLDNELKPFKQNLVYRGNEKGDGSGDPSKLQRGAMGSVGISISPATPWYGGTAGSLRSINIVPRIV